MAEHAKTVARALELLGSLDDEKEVRPRAQNKEIEDCAAWVVAQVESTIDGLAETERLDAESVALALAEVDDMEREAVSELRLAARAMRRDGLEWEEWLAQRVAELESRLGTGCSTGNKVSVDEDR